MPDPANDGLIADGEAPVTETTTFCKVGDDKRPGFVNPTRSRSVGTQLCPDDLSMGVDEVADAEPLRWYARVEFDELLNPDIEDLIPILDPTRRPRWHVDRNDQEHAAGHADVRGVDVPYDGYYGPERQQRDVAGRSDRCSSRRTIQP